MDKYEEKLKLDELKNLISEEKYKQAEEIADTMNWKKMKNVNDLVLASEIYKNTERYEDSRELLLLAYDRSPIGRKIIYMISELAITMKNFEEAQEYYDEFIEIAPHDNLKYVLRYEMKKEQGASLEDQIAILEELKDKEYTEKWAYELAYLYHQAGNPDKAIDVCDELVLWFGEGKYVEKALELKMLYQPLTTPQEEKYRSFMQEKSEKNGVVEILPEEKLESGEIVHEPVSIPKVKTNTGKFNTVNLQQELAKSMQQIMDATEKETVSSTINNIKKMVEDIPYLQMPTAMETSEKVEIRYGHLETDEEIDGSLRINFQEILAEENDGQLSLNVPQEAMIERQITGQMSISDVLDEWEKTKYAAEAALMDAKQRKLESAKARALQEAEDILERLKDVIPKLDAGYTPKDILVNEYLKGDVKGEEAAGRFVADMNQILQEEIDKLSKTTENLDQLLEEEKQQSLQVEEKIKKKLIQPTKKIPNLEKFINNSYLRVEGEDLQKNLEEDLESFIKEEPKTEEEFSKEAELLYDIKSEDSINDLEQVSELDLEKAEIDLDVLKASQNDLQKEYENETDSSALEDSLEDGFFENATIPIEEQKTSLDDTKDFQNEELLPVESLSEKENYDMDSECEEEESDGEIQDEYDEDQAYEEDNGIDEESDEEPQEDYEINYEYQGLNEEDKEMFSYFIPVNGMTEQIEEAMTNILAAAAEHTVEKNLVISGIHGSGKTVLATSFVKVLQLYRPDMDGKIGKIQASVLNQKEIPPVLKKVQNGCLIIENAGDLSKETAVKMGLCLSSESQDILVILEDTKEGIRKALSRDDGFAKKFTQTINIPVFTIDELVLFAKAYANEQGYEIDEMAMLALYNNISKIQRLNEPTNLTDVKQIVDDAIAHANKGAIKKIMNLFTSRRLANNDYISLREKDFDE